MTASVHAVASADLADADVCERALDRVRDRLSRPIAETAATTVETDCPGFTLLVSLAGGTRAGFDALGERGLPAEDVADAAVDACESWLDGPGVVDAHLADQLVVPLALIGGSVRVPRLTAHVRTNCELVEAFGYDVDVRDEGDEGAVLSG
ncbi:RNA 3'-terminal phosphate cyclase [Salinigranum sp. GCM10025319]|uniref:RNA 3'-terminal phosphate cyclase n=1 Tax=Salinigranum sp. GCM10025319 TaxID=3252687 RepID=UPI003607C138